MNVPEVLFTTFSMICGASIFAFVVGNMTSLLAKLDIRATGAPSASAAPPAHASQNSKQGWRPSKTSCIRYRLHGAFVAESAQENMPLDVRYKVRKYFNYLFTHNRLVVARALTG